MKISKKKLYISIVLGLVFFIAVIWLVVRGCSGSPVARMKTYQIGRDSTWYPVDLRGKEQAMVGFSNDLIKAIAAERGFKAVVFEVGPNALFDGLDIGNYDAVLSSLTPNSINRKNYAFSDPFYLVGPVLIVNEDSNIDSLREMTGKIMGIESGALQVFNIPEPPDIVIIPYDTAATALENLDQKVIDGVLLDALRAYVWTDGFYADRLKVVTSPLTDRGFRVVTRNRPEFLPWLSEVNEGLKAVKEKGIYDQLLNKWDLIDTESEKDRK